MANKRVAYIETLRGIACILIVSWHVVGLDQTDGLRLPIDHPLHEFGFFLLPLRMPLFAFLSGFVFSAAVSNWGDVGSKFSAKARRLLLPLLFAGGLHYVIRAVAYDEPLSGIWHVYFDSYAHFWYLHASFILMTTLLVATYFSGGREKVAATLCLAAFSYFYLLEWHLQPINWFAITKAAYIGAFFYLGQFFRTHQAERWLVHEETRRRFTIAALFVLVVVLYYFRQTGSYEERTSAEQTWQSLVLSAALVTLLFTVRWENKWLAAIGPYSYAIFLFHVIFTASIRMLEVRLFPGESPYLMWGVGLVLGIAGPILVQMCLDRGPASLRTMFLGVRYASREKEPIRQSLVSGCRAWLRNVRAVAGRRAAQNR